ncbi:hypothetical protein M3181_04105 [Mesobacillus maritimus]|uniref:HipA family kinase n=1 Tax=Mesobacillus maritimus TaxID=1643336 RepID=UPI00203BD62D|nr:HipA family kinase [Mesobacillus maritimus]MCM3668184.1 hypothetical protein [Mesobacillus maritimus]
MIKPTASLKTLPGKSNAQLLTFDDGQDYVVKSWKPEYPRSLANEWLGYAIARYLQLPVPFGRIVEFPAEFLNEQQEAENGEKMQQHFASLFVPDCINGHEVGRIETLTNTPESLAGIILFDYWVANRDRTRKNILFQPAEQQGVYQLWAIDQAEILTGFDWNLSELEQLPTELIKSTAHKMLIEFIDHEQYFYQQLEVIQSIPILLLEEIVELIPEKWEVTKEERKAIITALLHRRHKVLPKVMERFLKRIYRPIKEGK